MRGSRYLYLVVVAAILLPILVLVALEIGFSYRARRAALEAGTLDRAERVVRDVDLELARTAASLSALTTIRSINERSWTEAEQRAKEIMALNADWRAVSLIDLETNELIFDTEEETEEPPEHLVDTTKAVTIDGIGPDERGAMRVFAGAPVVRDGKARYFFVLRLDPKIFQTVLLAGAPPGATAAIVDRNGNFVARTIAYEKRLGTPATRHVRDAVARGTHGIYTGVTYEGVHNYTAFVSSRLSGWTVHVAISAALIDTPEESWWVATLISAALALVLAVILAWIAARLLRTERRTEARLRQAERMQAIGQMTGGIAHDFNNMLAVVIGSLDLAQRQIRRKAGNVDRYLDSAREAARRAAELTQRMLAFARQQVLSPSAVLPNKLIADMSELLLRTVGADRQIVYSFAEEPWAVFVDPGQLENAVVNLAANARDAMSDGGRLRIATRNLPAKDKGKPATVRGDCVAISVTDYGVGMTREVAEHAIEPFFTTKEVGKGTGLGLAQIYGFVRQSGGDFAIATAPGKGTTVTLYLPRHEGVPTAVDKREVGPDTSEGSQGEKILLVEDDDLVRETNADLLSGLGYEVVTADGGTAALEILRGSPEVALLLTDIVMPDMGGRRLAREALGMRSDLKVLFVTGYEQDAVTAASDGPVLRKPFSTEALGEAVRNVLDEA